MPVVSSNRSRAWGLILSAGLCAGPGAMAALGDEGMWLLNAPPRKALKERYGFEATPAWLEHLQKSAVRFGASASLVSADGLMMTNHHVGSDAIQQLSTPQRDIMTDGYLARSLGEELRVPGGEATILQSIEDVTARVNQPAEKLSGAEANAARQKAIAAIEREEQERTGLQCRVVTLYGGGQYHLYRSKRYTDIRLVFAPEKNIAFFGGDTDNFEYPRFNLDITFFRIYENDRPIKSENFLKWSPAGVKEGELTFVVGHPGRTQRLLTADHLRFVRDVEQPHALMNAWRTEVKLQTFAGRSKDNAVMAREDLFGVTNGRKARTGQLAGLLDPGLFNAKIRDEQTLRAAIEKDPTLKAQVGDAFERWSRALQDFRAWYPRYHAVSVRGLGGDLAAQALTMVRLFEELPKPNGERLREFRDSALPRVYQNLLADRPVPLALEQDQLTQGLTALAERLGGDDTLVRAVLGNDSPASCAEVAIRGTRLHDPAERQKLVEAAKAIRPGQTPPALPADAMLDLAKRFDGEARALRKRFEDQIESVERETYAKITPARFAVFGTETYPDATGTLRLSFGRVLGYRDGQQAVPAFTTFAGLYARATERAGESDFVLPPRWVERREKLDQATAFNFVCTADIIGGNSGSPVVNQAGELVGIAFDGNIHSLPWAYAFSEAAGRTVAVDSRGIIESLRKVYDANALADELTTGQGPAQAR
jgi:hypothetical protein